MSVPNQWLPWADDTIGD